MPAGGDRRPDKSVVRIGNFNLAWLFDGVNDPTGSPWTNPPDAQRHINAVAQQILRTNVDILAVHEVRDEREEREKRGRKDAFFVWVFDDALFSLFHSHSHFL